MACVIIQASLTVNHTSPCFDFTSVAFVAPSWYPFYATTEVLGVSARCRTSDTTGSSRKTPSTSFQAICCFSTIFQLWQSERSLLLSPIKQQQHSQWFHYRNVFSRYVRRFVSCTTIKKELPLFSKGANRLSVFHSCLDSRWRWLFPCRPCSPNVFMWLLVLFVCM